MIPFSTSTQFTAWTVANCGDCDKSIRQVEETEMSNRG